MEVSITKFRSEIFDIVNQAIAGTDVWVTHKGQRIKLVPDQTPPTKLSQLTSMQIINPNSSEEDEVRMKEEMRLAWEKDWEDL